MLEGALAYAIEILTVLGDHEEAAVIGGAARSGCLTHLRDLHVPRRVLQRRRHGAGLPAVHLPPADGLQRQLQPVRELHQGLPQ